MVFDGAAMPSPRESSGTPSDEGSSFHARLVLALAAGAILSSRGAGLTAAKFATLHGCALATATAHLEALSREGWLAHRAEPVGVRGPWPRVYRLGERMERLADEIVAAREPDPADRMKRLRDRGGG